jgi:hypothetical protein
MEEFDRDGGEAVTNIHMSSSAKADDPVISGARDLRIEIVPIRVHLLDQFYFPRAIPSLKTFLPADCCFNIGMLFEIDEAMDAIVFCKSRDQAVPMLVHSAHQVVGHADVECPTNFAGKNVNRVIAFGDHVQDAAITGSSAFADDDNHSK